MLECFYELSLFWQTVLGVLLYLALGFIVVVLLSKSDATGELSDTESPLPAIVLLFWPIICIFAAPYLYLDLRNQKKRHKRDYENKMKELEKRNYLINELENSKEKLYNENSRLQSRKKDLVEQLECIYRNWEIDPQEVNELIKNKE